MSWRVRAAHGGDLDALAGLAAMTGGGFTNLPRDREALARRLAWSDVSYARRVDAPDNELYILLLEHLPDRRIGGCAMLFSRIGVDWPFYSYKLNTLSQTSKELGRSFATRFLSLTTDHDGASEVGGLFLHPDLRTGGLGRLLARSRYLFIARHRARFAGKVLAELRGVMDEAGNSPFWDAIGAKFFGMRFPEADSLNAAHGNQFIADLMPRHPIYTALLPEAAQAAIGQPHPAGRAALALLQAEGFVYDNYIDIFDGGPTVTAPTDAIRTVRGCRPARVERLVDAPDGCTRSLIAAGHLTGFTAWLGHVADNGRTLPAGEAGTLGIAPGTEICHVDC